MFNSTVFSNRVHECSPGDAGRAAARSRAFTPVSGPPRSRPLLVRGAPESPRGDVVTATAPDQAIPPAPSAAAAATSAAESPAAAAATTPTERPSDIIGEATRKRRPARQADSTDAVATFLSRRFGIAGGLAWLGFLAIGTLGEQIKTRLEVANEINGTKDVADAPEVVLPSGVRYRDLRVGGGQNPIRGYLVVLDFIGTTADGVQFESTRARGKPIVFLYGSRPYTGGMCAGLEQALSSMKAGGRRIVTVPPELGFGERGAVLRPTEHVPDKQGVIPPGAELVYDVELVRVSIPPS